MKTRYALAVTALILPSATLLTGCDGESPTSAIPKTERTLNSYALEQIYMVPITTGDMLDADALKSQIDVLVGEYGEEEVVDRIKEVASDHVTPAYRAAATYSAQHYVPTAEYNRMVDALDDDAMAAFSEMTP